MVGGVALSVGRGTLPTSRGPAESPAFDTARVEFIDFVNILEATAGDSIWAVESGWPNAWARRLDSFALELDDPRRQDLLDEERFASRHAEYPFPIPDVESAGEVDKDIVKIILADRQQRRDDSILDAHNDLMVELINLQRSRW